jgi:hypothetical protein
MAPALLSRLFCGPGRAGGRWGVLLALALGGAAGCAVRTHVAPSPALPVVTTLYVQNNPAVFMSGFLPEMLTQLRAQGFHVVTYDGARPPAAVYRLTYTANWKWHWAMYLSYFHVTFWRNDTVLGSAEYDARRVGPNPDKYGPTAGKIRPLLIELLKGVARPGMPVAGVAGS